MKDYRIDGYLKEIESHYRQIEEANIMVWRKVRDSEDAVLLTSIPGVGKYTALVISAEIGDISRFPDSHKLCAYAGIVPSVSNSADIVNQDAADYLLDALREEEVCRKLQSRS